MPISGVVIKYRPEQSDEISSFIASRGAIELLGEEGGTLVAVIETASVAEEVDLIGELLSVEGVLDVGVAYHNFEDIVDGRPSYMN